MGVLHKSGDALKNTKPNTPNKKKPLAIKPTRAPFPIVGIGASAGGLEAFIALLTHLKTDLGMAYVLVMHLSPNHKSALVEILRPKTQMPVYTVRDGMKVKPNSVYIIPPNVFMSLVDGHLKLAPRSLKAIGNFVIDYFMNALASIYENNAIGVILSGTATDGTLGLKAVKAHGGITFAQDDTAKFSGMPQSAYDSGYADFILSPEEIAKELAVLATYPYTVLPTAKIDEVQQKELKDHSEDLKKILRIVKNKHNVDFFLHYKQASIYRRVVRRMILNKFSRLSQYVELLEANSNEVDLLYTDFLINVTSFFRDPDFYKTLEKKILPAILKDKKATDPFRIWIAGCATGEEAYSVAISMFEYFNKKNISVPINIFGSDLDAGAIEKARTGIYSLLALQRMPANLLKKYFRKIDGHYQITKSIREVCIFSQQNLLSDPPFSRMDLISCQNVLIYFEGDPQNRVLETFHYALKPTGFLFLGNSETVGSASNLFESLDKKIRLFGRKPTNTPRLKFTTHLPGSAPAKAHFQDAPHPIDIERNISKLLLTRFVTPSLVLDQSLNIVQFYGVTTSYLAPVVGKASLNVLKMIREDLVIDVRTLLQRAKNTGTVALKEGIRIFDKKISREVTIEVIPQSTDASPNYYLIVFLEQGVFVNEKGKSKKVVAGSEKREREIVRLEQELAQSRDLIKSTNEEYETTYEELQANNEEILSSNEELQSVNEELETSKEELQSANEELTTINDELNKRNLELKESQTYAEAIIQTIHNPLLVLTANFQVRMANEAFYQTFKLTKEDAEGSFVYELGNGSWQIPTLREELNDLLSKKVAFREFELVHDFIGLGEMVLDVHAYRLDMDAFKETLVLLAFNSVGDLQLSNKRLKSANEQLEQFAYISSHDLQEPLRKILTFSNYLTESSAPLNDRSKQFVEKIHASATRMSGLLKDLLSYSFFLEDKKSKKISIDLNTIFQNIIQDYELVIDRENAVVNVSKLPTIIAAPLQMNQLFFNLIGNALKFTRESPVINISAKTLTKKEKALYPVLKKETSYTCIEIRDNGIGFDQKYASKLFVVFQRLADKKDVEGYGIGLAICKKIVDDHEGLILATGVENQGATFTVILPV